MINKYPLWKYLMIGLVLLLGVIYAMPNLYGEDPALQISGTRQAKVDESVVEQVSKALQSANITVKSVDLDESKILVRLQDVDQQLTALEVVKAEINPNHSDQFIVAQNTVATTPSWLNALSAKPMTLGLDLRGGIHFLMEVDMEKAVAKVLSQYQQEFKDALKEQNIRYSGVKSNEQGNLIIRFRDADSRAKGLDILSDTGRDFIFSEYDESNYFYIKAVLTEEKIKYLQDYAVEQNMVTLRNRINELGVAEPIVQRQGPARIVVELPGVQDSAMAKKVLGATASLEFRLANPRDLSAALAGNVPSGYELMNRRDGGQVLLQKKVILGGDHISDAKSAFGDQGATVHINLDGVGGKKMNDFTKKHLKQPMATVFIEYKTKKQALPDGTEKDVKYSVEEVINVATIQDVLGQRFMISGLDSMEEASELSMLLRAGALIAPIYIVEERTIGPSLGQENIEAGEWAVTIGLLLVVVFMVVFYRAFGLIANCALLANIVLIIAVMSILGATLTLPGIAGIVLTVGMAVDANVLIFERIKEELKEGVKVQQAIYNGYDRALSTIADANITTLVAAIILFAVGTGPIKGFAVTLAFGILTSMFTAIVGTRAIVNLVYGRRSIKTLKI